MSNVEAKKCPQCGAPIDAIAVVCKFCGADVAVLQPQYQEQQVPQYAPQQVPQYVPQQVPQYVPPQAPYQVPVYDPDATSKKSKTAAGILAILLGGLGVHKFYLGRIGWGIVYILFCWTYIPSLLGIIEGIIYLTSSEEKFYSKHVKK